MPPSEARLIEGTQRRHRHADERQEPSEPDGPGDRVNHDGPRADVEPPEPEHRPRASRRGRGTHTVTSAGPGDSFGPTGTVSPGLSDGAARLTRFARGEPSSLRNNPT